MSSSAVRRVLGGALAVALLTTTAVVTRALSSSDPGPRRARLADSASPWPSVSTSQAPGLAAALATAPKVVTLHAATAPPQPVPPAVSQAAPIRPHEVLAFAPYWSLSSAGPTAVGSASTLAYFGLDVNGDGSVSHSGAGWQGYQSAELVNLINGAHAAGDRVVLSVECFSQASLDRVTSDPGAAARLAGELAHLVSSEQMDGVNFDFEGTGSGDREGLVRLIGDVASRLKTVDPNWQLTMDVYASSLDGGGFFDAAALATKVDALFVMAYDMGSRTVPSPTAPLSGPGYTDSGVVSTFARGVPAAKVLLGIPFYGYAWPTAGNWRGAGPTGPAFPLSYSQIHDANRPAYWDPTTQTPWTAWQSDGQWYEAYYDNPQSISLKVGAATRAGLGGVGVWALGMDGTDTSMLAAITGQSAPVRSYVAAPPPSLAAVASAGSGAGAPQVVEPPAGAPAAPAPAAPSPVAGKVPPPGLCSLLAYEPALMSTVQTAAQQEGGAASPANLRTVMTALEATAGCNGSTPAPIPAAGPSPDACALLTGVAQLAGVIQGAAGPLPTSLPAQVGRVAAAAGCGGVTGSVVPAGANCAGFTSLLDSVAAEAGPVQRYAEAAVGRSLGVDLASAVEGLAAGCSNSGTPDPSPQISTVCTMLVDVQAEAGALQTVAEAGIGHPLGVDLTKVAHGFGTPMGCP
ncbi:MAG TPA: glycosyl hydrolase family 18 protein [Acidimicrobiales bacterium]|nr:glycosyl hydrolase family 18 protein [Acidimicrobiales bacterium]